ncbi:hypothetical protein DSO57_1000050 [Entomophthora muscae]|uniref:Uncharacterized protein n=1 Tax=Entomophthora muscae TaxID=34485 RepID=A0ACC2SM81_9FUNG|nr:hypothetical protein DSO57_1000050 [Entomophthora muscae]
MNCTLARSMDLTCLGPKELLGASKVPVTAYPISKPLSYCTDSHVFVSRFLAVDDLLFPVILGVGWWCQHQVHIDRPANELHFSLDNSAGVLSLLKPGVEPLKSCLSLKASPEVPSPVLIPGILAPYQDALNLSLATALPQHTHHDVTFCTTVDLVKIDAPMYPLSEREDKALGSG